jgi:hypothetical protein
VLDPHLKRDNEAFEEGLGECREVKALSWGWVDGPYEFLDVANGVIGDQYCGHRTPDDAIAVLYGVALPRGIGAQKKASMARGFIRL